MAARPAALAGLASALWFFGATLVVGALRDGYDPLTHAISELGQAGAPTALAWNALGFGVTALLQAVFAAALWRALAADARGRWVAGLLAVAAVALAASGAFPCDPGCPPAPETLIGILHNIAGLAYFTTLALLPFVARRVFAARSEWRMLARPTLLVGIVLAALFLIGPLLGPARIGAWQRTFLLVAFSWLAAVSLRLYRLRAPRRVRAVEREVMTASL